MITYKICTVVLQAVDFLRTHHPVQPLENSYHLDDRRVIVATPDNLNNDEKVFLGIAQKPDDKKKYDEIIKERIKREND